MLLYDSVTQPLSSNSLDIRHRLSEDIGSTTLFMMGGAEMAGKAYCMEKGANEQTYRLTIASDYQLWGMGNWMEESEMTLLL